MSSDHYVRSFSVEWNLFAKTQLDIGNRTESRDTFIEKTGLTPEDLAGKLILEAGCGMGRFVEVISRDPTTTVIGFDLSLAVEAAQRNVGARSNVHIVQADIIKPPFLESNFDFVFSIGVLHHTPTPRRAFFRLVPLLREGGQLAIWVYAKASGYWVMFSDLYRRFTTKMPWSMLLGIVRILVRLHWIYERLPEKLLPYFTTLVPMSTHANSEWRLLDTFDWFSPKYQHKFTTDEVLSWFIEGKLEDIQTQSFAVSMKGRRPGLGR